MESILLEIHEAESKLQQSGLRQDSSVAIFEYYLKKIYSQLCVLKEVGQKLMLKFEGVKSIEKAIELLGMVKQLETVKS